MVDVWKTRHSEFRYTFSKTAPEPLMERIDYFLISFHLQQNVIISDILPSFLSDHAILVIHCRIETELSRGKGRWMFNNSYLEEESYVEEAGQIIT